MGADRITQGPSITGTNAYDSQALVLDVTNNILETSGTNRTMQAARTALIVLGAQTALSTVTTAQNLISKTLNAGVLNKALRTLLIQGSVIYTSSGTTTPTITIAVTLGGVSLCSITTAAVSSTASTNMPVQFEFQLQTATTGSSGTIESHGYVYANISANTPAAASGIYCDTNTAVSSSDNLASALALAVTVAASSTITSVQLRQASVECVF